MLRLHGFDWAVYKEHIMPAFARWLVEGDEADVYQFYKDTPCARQEQFLPPAMQQVRIWVRAQAFVKQLPRGPHALREYQRLCAVEQFTALSDRYSYRHPPQLYQNSDALRTVWGAIIEEYCMPWFRLTEAEQETPAEEQQREPVRTEKSAAIQQELVSLLHEAGLEELAQEVDDQWASEQMEQTEQLAVAEQLVAPDDEAREAREVDEKGEEDEESGPQGVAIGRQPTPLHLRGWLAANSVRAMALFELLACARRCMPFGSEAGEPFGGYIGYLTPDEVWQLALCLRDIRIPSQAEAEQDYRRFRAQQVERSGSFRMIDEVLPAHASTFVRTVRITALQGLGLLCRAE